MYRRSRLAILLAVSLLAACAQSPCHEPGPLPIETTTASGQPIRFPQGDAWILRSVYKIDPGVKLPVHKHPYHRLALVLSGTLTVTNTETGRTVIYGPGDMVVESVDQWHFGASTGRAQVHLRVLDLVPKGVEKNTVLKE